MLYIYANLVCSQEFMNINALNQKDFWEVLVMILE